MYKKIGRNFKRRWVKALRGEYKTKEFKQTRGILTSTRDNKITGYCCIAVGAAIADVPEHKLINMETCDAARKCGLNKGTQAELVEMNDAKKYNFDKIADWIEKNL
jgi:hypothetical protein